MVARSSVEAEFQSMALCMCELLWLKILLNDLRIEWTTPIKLYCNNKSAINIVHNPVQHNWIKHVEVDKHFIKEKLDSGLICTSYISSHDQLANILTKGLLATVFKRMNSKIGMHDIHAQS